MWFEPNTFKLHVVDGQPDAGNANCNVETALPVGVTTTVFINIGQGFMEVSTLTPPAMAPVMVCDAVRKARGQFQTVSTCPRFSMPCSSVLQAACMFRDASRE